MNRQGTPYKPYSKERIEKLEKITLDILRLVPKNQNMSVQEMRDHLNKKDGTIKVTFLKKDTKTDE